MTVPESRRSRRYMLTRIGAGATAIAGGLVFLPDTPTSPHVSATDEADDAPSPPEEKGEDAIPYAIWQYKATNETFEATAPINVVFPLDSATFDDVVTVFQHAEWYPFPEEYVRYAWDRDREQFERQHWTGAETYFGKVGRYHVRCWQLDGTISVQAHRDSAALPNHKIESYAEGRKAVETLFQHAGWDVQNQRLPLGNGSDPDHDGWASVIRSRET